MNFNGVRLDVTPDRLGLAPAYGLLSLEDSTGTECDEAELRTVSLCFASRLRLLFCFFSLA